MKDKFNILSFVVEMYQYGQLTFTEYNTGGFFSSKAADVYSKLVEGDKMVIKSIVIKDDIGYIYELPPIEFRLDP